MCKAQTIVLTVSTDFSKFPSGITKDDGSNCAENFRDNFLIPCLKNYRVTLLDLDGAMGYSSSWLKESFGKLVYDKVFTSEELHKKLVIFSQEDESLEKEIWQYIDVSV